VVSLTDQITRLFAQAPMTYDSRRLIGRDVFDVDVGDPTGPSS
jgi:hypothetical protein